MDSRMYPQGSGTVKSRYVAGVLTFYDNAGNVMYAIDPITGAITFTDAITANGGVVGDVTGDVVGAIDAATINGVAVGDSLVRSLRVSHTTAELNSGQVLLAALSGFKYRIIGFIATAVGGAMTTATSLELEGNQSGVVDLFSIAAAAVLENDPVGFGGDDGVMTVLAAGASFLANDANTAIGLSATGTAATMTSIVVDLTYTIEA